MNLERQSILNYGIIAPISWNSNKWTDLPMQSDLDNSRDAYVLMHRFIPESFNFGHDSLPAEDDGYYIGYSHAFNKANDFSNSENVGIVFFMSSDYHDNNRKSIVGFYDTPIFGDVYKRNSNHVLFRNEYNFGNIKAFPENIFHLTIPLFIDYKTVKKHKLLPQNKLPADHSFIYIDSDTVHALLKIASFLNPNDKKLKGFVDSFYHRIELRREKSDLEVFTRLISKSTADTMEGILNLEKKMHKYRPEIKRRISSFIEQGAVAEKVKRTAGYRCILCEALGRKSLSFKNANGKYYIEVHHVVDAALRKKRVLNISNLMTVCANHHRQLHEGNSIFHGQNDHFLFLEIDGKGFNIKKINITRDP